MTQLRFLFLQGGDQPFFVLSSSTYRDAHARTSGHAKDGVSSTGSSQSHSGIAGSAATSAGYADASMLAEETAAAAAMSPSDDALHRRHVDTHAGPAT
eukprot:363901-Chlamydomonas_euryale.AAC.1